MPQAAQLASHARPALANTPQIAAADLKQPYNPNAKPILALRMPNGSNLIISGRTRHQIALADPTCKAVKTTLIDYDPSIHTDEWVQMTNAGEHIINRTATTEHYRTYFTHNPITHAQAIEQGLVPIDPRTGRPTAAYTKGRQLAIFKDGQYSHASQQDADVLTGEVPVNLITHSEEVPQFKTNKAGNRPGKDGVVYALPGEYRTHDPIHIWHRKDGTLVIISGRHRLAKAIEAGATHIPATVYPETDERNATWARVHDAEQNVLDNQASVADTALYVKGYNPKGRPLTEEETKQFTRKGSNSELGSYIGLHGSDTLIDYLSRGAISPEYAYKIAQFAPDDPDTQNLAVAELVTLGKGIQESLTAAGIYRDTRNNRDDDFSALFQTSQQEEDFNRFLASYAASKIRTIGLKRRPHKAAASERSVREHQEAGIQFENIAHNRQALAHLTAEQDKWRNPSLHPELRQEAYEEFKKTAEGAQDYFNFGSFSLRAKRDLTFTCDKTLKASNVKQSLARLAGKELTCLNSPIVATVNSRQRGKLVSPAARDKSVANGFTQQQHLTLASRVDDLYKYAIPIGEYNDKNGRANLRAVFRFAVPVQIDGKTAFALLTLKRVDKDNLYSLELEEINQLGGTLDRLNHLLKEEPSTIPLRAAEDIVAELASKVKEYFGENALPPITATQVSSLSLRRSVDRNINSLLNEHETTLARVSNYIKREADRTANIMGGDTELQRAGVHFAQANAIINALDTYIFSKEIIRKNTAEYRRLCALRNYLSEYIRIAAKGKLLQLNNTSHNSAKHNNKKNIK